MKSYWMLQNTKVTAFTVSELFRKNQYGWCKITPPPLPDLVPRDKVKEYFLKKLGNFEADIVTPKSILKQNLQLF